MNTKKLPRKIVIEFEADVFEARVVAARVASAVQAHLEDPNYYITADFSPPEGWDRFKFKPTITITGGE